MSKLGIGDEVVVDSRSDITWYCYVAELDDKVGCIGTVRCVDSDDQSVYVEFEDNTGFWFETDTLRLTSEPVALTEAEFIKKQIKQLKKRLKEIENE